MTFQGEGPEECFILQRLENLAMQLGSQIDFTPRSIVE